VKRISVLLLCIFFALGAFADEITFESKEEREAKIAETVKLYEDSCASNKMDGNFDVYYQLFDSLGKGYVKLDFDVILQIKDFKNIKSDQFHVSIRGKDDMGYKYEESFKFKRSAVYLSPEGDGIFVKTLSIEKGVYSDLQLAVNGNKGENASALIKSYNTIDMANIQLDITEPIFIYSLNTVNDRQFYRRGMYLVPTIDRYYDKNRAVGFYFEYYHIAERDNTLKGAFTIKYALVHELSQIEIFSDSMTADNASLDGNQQVFLDISTATPGVYSFRVAFIDDTSGETREFSRLFRLADKPEPAEAAE